MLSEFLKLAVTAKEAPKNLKKDIQWFTIMMKVGVFCLKEYQNGKNRSIKHKFKSAFRSFVMFVKKK